MKKILFYLTLISLLPATTFAGKQNDGSNHTGPVSEYVKSHIMPVVTAKRMTFDAFLSSTEKNELASIREQLQQLRENRKAAMRAHSEAMNDENATTQTWNENRSENHAKMKELMEQVHIIAANHHDELDRIFNELAPQREQWKNDIRQIVASKENAEERNAFSSNDNQHYWMGGRFNATRSRSGFLLLATSDATTSTSDNERQAVSGNGLPASSTMSIFPNPAINDFTLNLSGIPVENKLIISDMTGKTIIEKENLLPSENETISCSDLSNGIYFVRLSTPDQTINEKLIISH